MKIPSWNLARTYCVQKLFFLTFRTILVHNMFSSYSGKRRAFDLKIYLNKPQKKSRIAWSVRAYRTQVHSGTIISNISCSKRSNWATWPQLSGSLEKLGFESGINTNQCISQLFQKTFWTIVWTAAMLQNYSLLTPKKCGIFSKGKSVVLRGQVEFVRLWIADIQPNNHATFISRERIRQSYLILSFSSLPQIHEKILSVPQVFR